MTIFTMVCALFGLTSPANRGGLLTTLLILFVFMGSFAGYFSARLDKMFKGKAWKRNTFLTAFSFSGSLLTIVAAVNAHVRRLLARLLAAGAGEARRSSSCPARCNPALRPPCRCRSAPLSHQLVDDVQHARGPGGVDRGS
jgi:NhaP-type Na+/H+ or K+/H+ antiporter